MIIKIPRSVNIMPLLYKTGQQSEVHFRDIIDIFTGWHRYGIMIKFKSVNIFSLKYEYEKSRAHKCSGR